MENEQMEPNMNGTPQNQSAPQMPKKEGGIGPVIGIIIIIILLGLGGVYYFTTGVNQIQNDGTIQEDSLSPEEEAAALLEQSASTDLSDIEADLEATDLSGLDSASTDFDLELQAQ